MIFCGTSLDCWKLGSKVLIWPHGGKGVLFVLFVRGVPFRVSVADERRMIGLAIPGLILVLLIQLSYII